jgi:Ca2+-binding RTX toxin-like protein
MAIRKSFDSNGILVGTNGADKLIAYGDNSILQGGAGNDTYLLNSNNFDGDTITGTLTYSPVLSSDPECAQYACAAVQDYTGVRPSSG